MPSAPPRRRCWWLCSLEFTGWRKEKTLGNINNNNNTNSNNINSITNNNNNNTNNSISNNTKQGSNNNLPIPHHQKYQQMLVRH